MKSWEGVGKSYLILQNIARVSVKLLREARGQGSPKEGSDTVVRQQGLGTFPVFSIALQGADRAAEFPASCEAIPGERTGG